MSRILDGLRPNRVMYFFEEICKIPHGSYNVKALSDFCVSFAKQNQLEVFQDQTDNVVIIKAASAGYEEAPALMLQGHLDMVCEKNADKTFDFKTQGIELIVDGDKVKADGTTLGADNGIAVAYALAILEDKTLEHPRLEVIFTAEEEVGMDGAANLDMSLLQGKYLINLDSEDEGYVTTGCAGGLKATAQFNYETVPVTGQFFELSVKGLQGGHSGTDINRQRGNANRIIGRILFELRRQLNIGLVSLYGGMKDNAIPREAFAGIVLADKEDGRLCRELVSQLNTDIKNELSGSDPEVLVEVSEGSAGTFEMISPRDIEKIIFMLINTPCGIQTMSSELPGLVESSLNLGIVKNQPHEISFCWAIRSSKNSLKWFISHQLEYMTELFGGTYTFNGVYPGWEYRSSSNLRNLISDTYQRIYGKPPVFETIHAGLECGLFAEKLPELDIVSIGPDIRGAHTPDESFSISSVERVYNYLLEVINEFNKYCY